MKTCAKFTKDYSLFIVDASNRTLVKNPVLTDSMIRHGYLQSKPMSVRRVGNKFRVLDGHHRLTTAMNLGIGVWYIEEKEDVSVIDLERAVKLHKPMDFVQVHIGEGREQYVRLRDYAEAERIAPMLAVMLAGGLVSNSDQRAVTDLIGGNFTWNDSKAGKAFRDTWSEIVNAAEIGGCGFARKRGFVLAAMALSRIVNAPMPVNDTPEWYGKIDRARLVESLRRHAHKIGWYGHRNDVLGEIEAVYNFSQKAKVPLKHHVLSCLAWTKSDAMKQIGRGGR